MTLGNTRVNYAVCEDEDIVNYETDGMVGCKARYNKYYYFSF